MNKKIRKKIILCLATFCMMFASLFSNLAVPVMAASEKVMFEVNKADEVIAESKKHLGKPYVWGASGPDKFDCSGFVSYVLKKTELSLGADRITTASALKFLNGKGVTAYEYPANESNPSNAKKGDLVFYFGDDGEVIHMGIYIGGGQIIHCAEKMPSGKQNQVMISGVDDLGTKHGTSIITYKVYRIFPQSGGMRIKKVNEDGQPLAGVVFEITLPDGTKKNVTTGSDGLWDSEKAGLKLKAGTYKVKEISTVEGYLLDSTVKTVEIKDGEKASENIVSFTNKEPRGEITLTKYNENKSQTLEGTKFHVTSNNGYVNDVVTDKNGKIHLTDLKLGTYTFKETQASNGYLLNSNPIVIELNYKDQHTSVVYGKADVTNSEPTGNIVLTKYNDDKSQTLAGTHFHVTSNTGYVKDVVTDKNGKIELSGLKLGTYTFTETKASDGYLLNTKPIVIELKYKDQLTSVIYGKADVTNSEPTGKIELVKYNEDKSQVLEGTHFHVTSNTGFEKDVVTDKNGKIVLSGLKLGIYTFTETQASDGYLLNTKPIVIELKYKEQLTSVIYESVSVENKEPKGRIDLTKTIDTSDTNGSAGDAVLDGNIYQLYAKEKITNKAGTKVFFEKDQLISEKKTDSKGKISWDNIPVGNYYIKESKSNDTLFLNNKVIDVSIKYQGQNVSKILVEKETQNRVNMQKIQVFKSGEKDGISGFVKGLQGAEFTFKLQSEVNHVGWDKAKTYAVITTDKDGLANTPYLPYGTYLVKETKTPKDYITAPDFTISVTDDYTEYKDIEQIKRVNINNRPFTSQVKLVKVDKETGKTVTLNSAKFKIKDSKGNYVVQKVFGMKFDTFTTNSKNQITAIFGDKGAVTLPLALDAGTYTIEEIKVPEGFLELEQPVQFTITNQHDYDVDEDKEPLLTVKIANERPKGKIILAKTDKETGKPMQDVEYELTAKEDIINPIDGSKVFSKGDIVCSCVTNSFGKNVIDDLFMGHYELRETLTNEGYVLSETVHDIVLDQKDTTTKEYVMNVTESNIAPVGKIDIIKTDKDNGELLAGVVFELTAKEDIYSLDGRHTLIYKAGEKVSKDISQEGLYMTNELGEIHITDLPLGQYELKEVRSLDGYYTNNTVYDIDLSYDHTDRLVYFTSVEVQNVKSTTEISKVDATDLHELEGAHLSLKDKDGNIVEEWVSGKEPHIIRGLHIGEQYVLHEDLAPLGYNKAEDVVFIINDDGKPTKVVMKDEITITEISKVDATNSEELEGAHLSLKDKDGNIVEEWISGREPHSIRGLYIGEQYVLHEDLAPLGYHKTEDVVFTINDDGKPTKVVMKDEITVTEISKVDATDSKELEGAHLSLRDKDGNIVEEWISGREPHSIRGLYIGEQYVLHEDLAPLGYHKAEDVVFTINDDGKPTKVVMKDEITVTEISKVDATDSKELEGAHLSLRDKDGNIVEEWISGKEPHIIHGLHAGEQYVLHEDLAPLGYATASDITFTVLGNGEVTKVVMKDELLPKTDVPDTGDDTDAFSMVLLAGASIILGLAIIKKAKKDKDE